MFWYFMEGFERTGKTAIYSASRLIHGIDILRILIYNGLVRYAVDLARQQVNPSYSSFVSRKDSTFLIGVIRE
jgi:hypothetical protein